LFGGLFAGGALYDLFAGPGSVLYHSHLDLSQYRIAPGSDIRPL
jgi:hypothetical protein